jgi:hypothetical protein
LGLRERVALCHPFAFYQQSSLIAKITKRASMPALFNFGGNFFLTTLYFCRHLCFRISAGWMNAINER